MVREARAYGQDLSFIQDLWIDTGAQDEDLPPPRPRKRRKRKEALAKHPWKRQLKPPAVDEGEQLI